MNKITIYQLPNGGFEVEVNGTWIRHVSKVETQIDYGYDIFDDWRGRQHHRRPECDRTRVTLEFDVSETEWIVPPDERHETATVVTPEIDGPKLSLPAPELKRLA